MAALARNIGKTVTIKPARPGDTIGECFAGKPGKIISVEDGMYRVCFWRAVSTPVGVVCDDLWAPEFVKIQRAS
jgi:hypothetical protein